MKVRFTILLYLLIGVQFIKAQSIDKGSRVILGRFQVIEDASFMAYHPPFLAKPIYSDMSQAVNNFPEQLMSSLISASSQKWVDYNTYGGSEESEKKKEKYFDFIKTMNKDGNYYELKSKLNFKLRDQEFAIIKFYFHSELLPEAKSGAYVMVKHNDVWKRTSNDFTSNLALMMMRFNEDKLQQILKAEVTNIEIVDTLIKKISSNGLVELSLLYKEFAGWYETNNQSHLDYFIDKNAW